MSASTTDSLELEARHGSPLAEGQPRRRRCQRELVTRPKLVVDGLCDGGVGRGWRWGVVGWVVKVVIDGTEVIQV